MVLEPFFDNELVDYAQRLPPELRRAGALYRKSIARHFPGLAQVEYTDSGARLADAAGNSTAQQLQSWLLGWSRRARRQAALRLPFLGLPLISDDPDRAIQYNTWLRTANRTYALNLLSRDDLYGDVFDAPAVRRLVEDHMAGRRDAFRLVNGVLTFALWRQLAG